MGMQIPHCVHSKISQEGIVRCAAAAIGRPAEAVGDATRESDRRRAFNAGPRAYAGVHTTEVLGIAGGGIHEREECHPDCSELHGKTQELHGRELLGESFWARGYFVSTVGRDEKQIREYIKKQDQEDQRIDQLTMFSK